MMLCKYLRTSYNNINTEFLQFNKGIITKIDIIMTFMTLTN
jgi:hypothetical protein